MSWNAETSAQQGNDTRGAGVTNNHDDEWEKLQTGYDGLGEGGFGAEQGNDDRACFNCGEAGHNKSDCPNPRKFSGACRVCNEEGHMAKDCPSKGPSVCKNCLQAGHVRADCTNARVIDRSHLADVDAEVSWEEIKTGIQERDVDHIKEAVQKYVKVFPDITYVQLQEAMTEQNMGLYLIATERTLLPAYTNMDLQGHLGKKYSVSYRFSDKPGRPREREGWPNSMEEILERLKDAGEVVPTGLPRCSNCSEMGHIAKSCPQEKVERTERQVACSNCSSEGHRLRDCPEPRVDKFACKNCGKPGHKAKECEETKCRNCDALGHTARDCPEPKNPKNVQCRNCDEMGHFSKDCPKPRDISRVKCSRCGEMGHFKSKCVNPPAAEAEASGDAETAGDVDSGVLGADAGVHGDEGWAISGGTAITAGGDDGW